MSKQAILGIIAVVLLIGAGLIVNWAMAKPDPGEAKQQIDTVLKEANRAPTTDQPSPGTEKSSDQPDEKAKEPVTKFVLAVANPSKQVTTDADKKAAMEYLSANLKGKVASDYGNDPVKLLDVPRPTKFTVANPRGASKGATVEVTFVLPSGEQKRLFSVERENGKWLITTVKAPTSR